MWHHKDELPNFKYNCEKCPYATNIWKSSKEHAYVHEPNRPYVCDYCGNGFRTINSLNAHKLIHTGEDTYGYNIVF